MVRNPFLGDMLTALFERRRLTGRHNSGRSIEEMASALLAEEGEVSGISLARAFFEKYATFDEGEKLAFFHHLNDNLEIDAPALRDLVDRYAETGAPDDYRAMTAAAESPRQELLRRLNQSSGATAALVSMRADLLGFLKEHPELRRTDLDFLHLLRSWFNRGFLVLRQINWNSAASILERIVAYEAVHAINDWEELRRRVYPPDRRCFAYFHPTMPDEPLIFVEVALATAIPGSIQEVLSEDRPLHDASETGVAVFYSISNCQKGLQGVSFGNLLIKQVAAELSADLPQLRTFVTLSPIPGLNRWLRTLSEDETAREVLAGTASRDAVEAMAARYLLTARNDRNEPLDPVARFHLGNGALIHAIHADADTTENGRRQSSGAMVNYLYDLAQIEKNHETYVRHGEIPATRSVRSRAEPPKPAKPIAKKVSAS